MKETEQIVFLGTGHATVTRCYNTCFVLKCGNYSLLVDGGGGSTILNRLESAKISVNGITGIFVTHTHTDHLLGVIWVLRMIGESALLGEYNGSCTLYGSLDTLDTIEYICRHSLSAAVLSAVFQNVKFVEALPLQALELDRDFTITPAETDNNTAAQLGFKAMLPSGKKLLCLGDAPCRDHLRKYADHIDWLLCESFCLDCDKEIFHPYDIGHGTVTDSAKFAEKCAVENLILYHTEDSRLPERKRLYAEEARRVFSGNIYVPDDLETIQL